MRFHIFAICLFTFGLLITPVGPANAQTITDCERYVASGQWGIAQEACNRVIHIIHSIRQDQSGGYCDNGCEHSLAEMPDRIEQLQMTLGYSRAVEAEATIMAHYGRLTRAKYWLQQAIANSRGIAQFTGRASPMLRALVASAKALYARQASALVVLDRRIAVVASHSVPSRSPHSGASSTPRPLLTTRLASQRKAAEPVSLATGSACNHAGSTVTTATVETPAAADRLGIYGVVNVAVDIDATGRPISAKIASSPSPILNDAALAAAMKSSFAPEVRNCKPIPGTYIFAVDFQSQ